MEIGIIATLILLAFVLAFSKTPAGLALVQVARLLVSALALSLVVAVGLLRPARPAPL